ncbi:MAG: molybdopterin-dependent oxidoreductase, partial [Chloroflexota bacterium]|nr:molybdopterin-dependent oxidoreductase [Chloroflexota bacterium]
KTPAWAEPIAGVPAATLAALAREYATTKPAALIAGWGPGRSAYGEQFHRAATALACLTGNIGIHGGNAGGYERSYPSRDISGIPVGRNPAEAGFPPRPNALGLPGGMNPNSARIHISLFWDAILKGKAGGYPADFKLLYLLGGNPLNQHPNTNQGVQALKKLEFIVVHEQFMTASARFADILLPASTFLERSDVAAPWLSAPYYVYVHQAIEPQYEAKSDFQICCELAPRLGIEHFSDQTEEEWLRELVKSSPDIADFDKFKEQGVLKKKLEEPFVSFKRQIEDPERHRFPTPSGKIELFSQLLADMKDPDMPPVPKYFENNESPRSPLARKYPLQLITPHFRRQVHAGYANCPWLAEVEPFRLWINTADAQARGIGDGERVKVFNDRGTTVLQARVTERIMPGVVSLPEGGNYRPDDKGVDWGGCANVLTTEAPTPGGGAAVNTCLVQVEKL